MEIKMPAYFIPHGGGPWTFMKEYKQDIGYNLLRDYLKSIPSSLPYKPKFIIVISAHWEENEITVITKPNPGLFYDYYGFPEETYNLSWNAKNDLNFSSEIIDILQNSGIEVLSDNNRDYDHGVFIPLMVCYPEIDIPVIQISLKKGLDAKFHIDLGKSLEKLRNQGALIFASGMNYHNMRGFFSKDGLENSQKFNNYLQKVISKEAEERNNDLINWKSFPMALQCHPREEHLIPLMVVSGASGQDKGKVDFKSEVLGVELISFKF